MKPPIDLAYGLDATPPPGVMLRPLATPFSEVLARGD